MTITESHQRSREFKVAVAWDALMRFIEIVDSSDHEGLKSLRVELLSAPSGDEEEEKLIHAALEYMKYVDGVNSGDDEDE